MGIKKGKRRGRHPITSKIRRIVKRGGQKVAKIARSAAKAVMSDAMETKESLSSSSDGTEIFHNSFITRSTNLLATTPGVYDPVNSNTSNRIGDKIQLLGISIKMMLELNERYSMGTFRIFVVKTARGDTPTAGAFWNNMSGNRMLDTINTERFSVLASKTVVIKQSSTGINPTGIQVVGSGYASGTTVVSRATKLVSIYIPGRKFGRNGVVQYENSSSNPKFFDYHLLVYSYSNYDTTNAFYVGRVNDEVIRMFYKDG